MTGARILIALLVTGLIAVVVGLPAQAPAYPPPVEVDREGPLCCAEDLCVEWSGATCSGALGWSAYALEVDADTGITHAERGTP